MSDVVWCLPAVKTFGEIIARALGLPLIVGAFVGDVDTAYIVGMYDHPKYATTNAATARAKRRVIFWCGNDARSANASWLPEATHLVSNDELIPILEQRGVFGAKTCWFPTVNHPTVQPLPEQPTVTFYAGTNPHAYNAEVVQFLAECMPDVRFIVYGLNQVDDFDALMAETTVVIQPAYLHGGITVREGMEAGRQSITTYALPYALKCDHTDPLDIISKVRKALTTPLSPDAAAFYARENSDAAFAERVRGLL